ncbi:MAG TPA: DUF5011 domain-containing protein [Candidatus Onthousia faecavium]|nr:DUF5011 domain-containing protein [Candidatus Onthousia faecavium]
MKKLNKKKIIRIAVVVLVVIAIILLVWFLYFYPRILFKNNEDVFYKAGERYYEINSSRFPSEEGRVISVTLDTLIKQDYLEELYVPYSDKLCDLKESTVKAVNTEDGYDLYAYLKCGKYESDVDHEGPKIELNGDKTMVIRVGSTYEEPGVKSVVDDVDGELDVASVTIKGEVNTNQVGSYEITYQASDKLNNRTTVTRTVEVREYLNETVRQSTTDGYYQGVNVNNYVMFNNMLFRIVRVNDDDTVTLVSSENLANVDYSNDRLKGSAIDSWLNDYFYNLLEKEFQDLIVEDTWCDDVVDSANATTVNTCSRESEKMKVGILSIQDYNKSRTADGSYLDSSALVWYANFDSNGKPWALTNIMSYPSGLLPMEDDDLFNVRPAITLKADTSIVSGTGTYNDPYVLIAKKTAHKSSKLNDRQIGEYVSYSGYLFRISDTLDDGITEVITTATLKYNDSEVMMKYNNGDKEKVYNPNEEGNIGYQVKNDMTRYINTDLFVSHKVNVPIYDNKVTYKGKHETKSYNLLITIPSTFDIFSAKGDLSSADGYWLIDSSKEDNRKTVIRAIGSTSYVSTSDDMELGVKVKAYFDDDVIITDGDGTYNNPYTISD